MFSPCDSEGDVSLGDAASEAIAERQRRERPSRSSVLRMYRAVFIQLFIHLHSMHMARTRSSTWVIVPPHVVTAWQ
jgi:hypothetical protein